MIIRINIGKIKIFLGCLIVFLLLASFSVGYAKYFRGSERLFGLVRLFSLDGEQNFPAWYQAMCLFTAGILAWVIGRGEKALGNPFQRHWKGLAVILTCMSVDEFSSFHELIGGEVLAHKMTDAAAKFHSLWLVVGVPFVLFFAVMYFKFWFSMPLADRNRFLAAGILYLIGVVGIESIGGVWGVRYGEESWHFAILTNIEETFEMLGQLTLLVALLRWIQRRVPAVHWEIV